MKKTIFKGTINGKQFDSVQEYNKEMMRAIAAGENVSAESHTETVEDDYDGSPLYHQNNDLPKLDKDYLDSITGNKNIDENLYNNELNRLSDCYERISKNLKPDYQKDIEKFVKILKDDAEANFKEADIVKCEMSSLKEEIRSLKADLDIIATQKKFIELYSDFYNDLMDLYNDCGCNDCKCECRECKCQQESEPLQVVNDDLKTGGLGGINDEKLSDAVMSLFKQIFNK